MPSNGTWSRPEDLTVEAQRPSIENVQNAEGENWIYRQFQVSAFCLLAAPFFSSLLN
jgi:hypothetical protein